MESIGIVASEMFRCALQATYATARFDLKFSLNEVLKPGVREVHAGVGEGSRQGPRDSC